MSKIAFIFPGQGSQFVGMGKDIFDHFASVRDIYEQANTILGFDLIDKSFNGPEEVLNQTNITQPAIFVHSYAMYKLVNERGLIPAMTAGHSLGEFSALTAAGYMDFPQALNIVKQRGELMHNASRFQKGTMAAIMGIETEILEKICVDASAAGIVGIANYNSPGQVVISGSLEGVAKAMELSLAAGAKRAIELKVSGAFHSPLMAPALEAFSVELNKIEFKQSFIKLYSNVTARIAHGADEIRGLLAKQLSNPVLWVQTVQQMKNDGAEKFFEIGPGSVLSGLLKRIDKTIESVSVNGLEQLNKIEVQN